MNTQSNTLQKTGSAIAAMLVASFFIGTAVGPAVSPVQTASMQAVTQNA